MTVVTGSPGRSVNVLVPMRQEQPALRPVDTTWRYTVADPHAVHIIFHLGPVPCSCSDCPDVAVRMLDRNLLAQGLDQPAGIGNVQLWPQHGRVALRLTATGGIGLFTADARLPRQFLACTYELVPAGQEATHVDVDRGLAQLLTGPDRP